jgi:hypothetical protein
MLDGLVNERGIEPHVPVFDKSRRTDDTFSRDDFTYDHDGDVYFCPGGKMLATKGTVAMCSMPTLWPQPTGYSRAGRTRRRTAG